MIYINPVKSFAEDVWKGEADVLVKVQIDNSLELGWKPEDIMLVTNFYYRYNGIESVVIGDEYYCPFSEGSPSKINGILALFEKGLIEDDLYWFHDFDAFQLEDVNIDLDKGKIALTDYGITTVGEVHNHRWSTGTLFFSDGTKDVFELIRKAVYGYQKNEEVSLLALTRRDRHGILNRIDSLNITYNFATRRRRTDEQYKVTDLPIKVIHFHPFDTRPIYEKYNNMEVCVYGKNFIGKPLVTQRLINIFKRHGIE